MANELMDSARPLWQVIQAHNLRFFYPYCHGCRTPTLQEQRSMAWQSIVRGANGIVSVKRLAWLTRLANQSRVLQFFFPDWKGDPEGWAGNMSWAQKWSNMAQLAEEIDAFAPVLLSDEAAPLPSVVENVSWVRTRAQWGPAADGVANDVANDYYYLFAANDANGSGTVTFRLPEPLRLVGNVTTVVGMVESAGRTIEGRGGEFSDSFGLLDVRVYRARVDRRQAMKNDDGLARTPPMGWRSWNSMLEDVSQEKILAQVHALAARRHGQPSLLDAGYTHIGIDDGWQACGKGVNKSFHDAQGRPIINAKFPDMRGMVSEANDVGVQMGWYGNNCGCSEADVFSCGHVYHCDAPTCGADDCGHDVQDAQAAAELGFSSIKIDLSA